MRKLVGGTEVDKSDAGSYGVKQEVAPVGVRLHKPKLEHFPQGEPQQQPSDVVTRILRETNALRTTWEGRAYNHVQRKKSEVEGQARQGKLSPWAAMASAAK